MVTINLFNIKNLNLNAVGVDYVACACFSFIDETVKLDLFAWQLLKIPTLKMLGP